MSNGRDSTFQALQLLVKKNDPKLFDNPEVFEKNMVELGCKKGTVELEVLKVGLRERIPWTLRKKGIPVDAKFINSLASDLSPRINRSVEVCSWAVLSWALAQGLKIKNSQELIHQNSLLEEEEVTTVSPKPESFSKASGARLGLVFGLDGVGAIKVYNSWYGEAPKSETSGMRVEPVKLKAEPIVLFKSAPKKVETKKNTTSFSKPKIDFFANTYETPKPATNVTLAEKPKIANTTQSPFPKTMGPTNPAPIEKYQLTDAELKAVELINKGGVFTQMGLKMLAPLGQAGSVNACRILGEVYYKGQGGVKQSFQAARAWLSLAANKGDAEAQFLMGNIYQFGMGINQELGIAKSYFEKAASNGHEKAVDSLRLL